MGTKDKRIDAYIAKSAPFAQPILKYIREVVHEGCPECEETMKWSFPHFLYKGMFCSMASFKERCAFGFWKAALVLGENHTSEDAMGSFGRLKSLDDLPSKKTLLGYIRKARELNDAGVSIERPRSKAPKELTVPDYFLSAVKKNKKALATFDGFPYSKKKDYVEWVTEAKTEETRAKRLGTTVEWLAEGKSCNWKYEKC